MQAAILEGSEEVSVGAVERPEPGPRQVRVELEGCGVCSSDLPVWEGRPWFEYPKEPGATGHEGWGRIDALGGEVQEVSLGDRVAFLSNHAYAEYDVADATEIVPLPSSLDGRPVPGEPLGCAMNVFHRSSIEPGQTVAIVGIGFLGSMLVELVNQAGAQVIALSRRPYALEMAKRRGAHKTIPTSDAESAVAEVERETDGRGCDCVIEATGKQEPLRLASRLVCVRGELVIAGYHQDGERTINLQRWNWRGIDVVNAHERDSWMYVQGMREAVDAMAEGRFHPEDLFTHTFSLEDLSAAFRLLQERPSGFMKALISL